MGREFFDTSEIESSLLENSSSPKSTLIIPSPGTPVALNLILYSVQKQVSVKN